MELIDGHLGSPHIDSNDKAIIHRGLRGDGSFVFEWGDSCSATVQDANHIMIGTGCGSIQGLDWSVTVPETVAIDSGSQGTNRNDIIAVRYAKDTSGVQTASLAVVKGTPSSGTATDPTIPSGDVLSAMEAWQPLWRIPISGISVGTPVQLFEILTPLKTVGDSVTPTDWVQLSPSVTYRKCAGIVIVMTDHLNITQKQTKIQIGQLPAGFRPGKRPQAEEDDTYAAVGSLTSRSDGMCGVIGVNAEGVVYVSANEVNPHFAGEVVFPATA